MVPLVIFACLSPLEQASWFGRRPTSESALLIRFWARAGHVWKGGRPFTHSRPVAAESEVISSAGTGLFA